MHLQPKCASNGDRIGAGAFPPSSFVAAAVDLTMVPPAQRHGELIAHLAPEGRKLRKPKMVSVRGLASADQAWLLGDESDMGLVPNAARLRQSKRTLVDTAKGATS